MQGEDAASMAKDGNMHKQIDIIVPIYNREKYIPSLIRTLKAQTFQDFRVIFVDDGSEDDSCQVLQRCLGEAAFAYTLIRQENGGASAARNTGLRAAEADWIAFMDSDDFACPEYLEYLHRAAVESGSDLAICGFQMVPEGSPLPDASVPELAYRTITPAQAMAHHYSSWIAPVCLLIKRQIPQENAIFFDETCIYCEDIPFITEVIDAAESAALIDQRLYYYRTHQGSLSRSPRLDKFLSGIEGFEKTGQKMRQRTSEAAAVFNRMGCARYYIATLRKAAVQMGYRDFSQLADRVDFRQYRGQISQLPKSAALASRVFLFSRTAFYYGTRLLFKD